MYKVLLFIFPITLLSGCAQYYVLTTDYITIDAPEKSAEIVATPDYMIKRKDIKTLAIQAPSRCASETSSQMSGKSDDVNANLVIECGPMMAEVERGLVKEGYAVISWVELDKTEKAHALSPRDAANQLRADAIFLINSMDCSDTNQGGNTRWDRKFFHSDYSGNGTKGEPAMVNDNLKARFIQLLKGSESRILNSYKRLSCTVNASVISVDTGKSVWFYDWTHVEGKRAAMSDAIHVACNNQTICSPVFKTKDNQSSGGLSSGDSSEVSVQGRPENEIKAAKFLLTKEAINNLVQKFKYDIR